MQKKKLLLYSTLGFVVLVSFLWTFQSKNLLNHENDWNAQTKKQSLQNVFANNNTSARKILKNKKTVMMGEADVFAQMHTEMRTRGNEKKPAYPVNYKLEEVKKAKQHLSLKTASKSSILKNMEIKERGPANVGGRTRAIAVDPTDEAKNTWFAGAVGGGIWKTTDAGETWENKTPELPNLAISSMAMAASNPDVIYAGTGEGFGNIDAIRGDGLIASFDHGETWRQVTGTINFDNINRIIIDPEDEKTILVAVSGNERDFGEIHKTMDGGNTWELKYEDLSANRIQHIISNPDNFNIQYASINAVGVIKSTDAGETWNLVLDLSNHARSELAIAPSNPDVVYAAVQGFNEFGSSVALLFKSEDAGSTWNDITNGGAIQNWLGAQGWYDNAIGINPFDENDVYLGGVQLWQLTESNQGISDVQQNGTQAFMQLVPWGGFQNSGVGTGVEFSAEVGLPAPINLSNEDYSSVEIKFGPGMEQKAHQFIFDGQQTTYAGYVNVPFEVWDTDNESQLMISFLDMNANAAFDLLPATSEITEIIWINAVDYSEDNPSSGITGNDGLGFLYKNTFTIMPAIADGVTWNPESLPESDLTILYSFSGVSIPTLQVVSSGYNPYTKQGTHVDHHNLTMVPMDLNDSTFRIINGNDGGVFYSDDKGINWEDCLHGYNTTQFYGADKKSGADEYIGGMQDNGTWQSPANASASASSNYNFRIGGDGYETSWHYTNPNLIIGGSQYNGLQRSTDGGYSWQYVGGQIDNGSGNAPFVTKVGKTNHDPDLLFAVGISGVWRSDNFGETWQLIEIPYDEWFAGYINLTQIEVSYANPQVVWAGMALAHPQYPDATLHVSTDGGNTFNAVSGKPNMDMGRISGLYTHPTDDQTAYALFSFADAPKILKTTDLGQTWEDISGFGTGEESTTGFPDVATYSLVVMPHNTNIIWVGTEIGLFESTDAGATWHYAIEEFPAVSIWQMNIVNDQIVIATHGRGIITITIDELPDLAEVTLAPKIKVKSISLFEDELTLEATLRSPYDSTQLMVNDNYYLSIPANPEPKDTTIIFTITEKDEIRFQLKSFENGSEYLSGIAVEMVSPLNEPAKSYINDFNEGSDDFVGSGFEIKLEDGFSDQAIHSQHPYANGINDNYMLLTPIVVKEENAIIAFNEIAIVEPGEAGSVYPTSSFFDYVVVEGSKNGKQWFSIEKGYDARDNDDWLAVYNSGSSVDESLYRKRTLDIHDRFSFGDTILIRFRLYSDQGVNSWGWAIDSLEIQKTPISVIDNISENRFSLAQNYPNPFNEVTNITFTIPTQEIVTLEIYNTEGRLVETLVNKKLPSGTYTNPWNSKNAQSGTYYYRIKAGKYTETKKLLLVK